MRECESAFQRDNAKVKGQKARRKERDENENFSLMIYNNECLFPSFLLSRAPLAHRGRKKKQTNKRLQNGCYFSFVLFISGVSGLKKMDFEKEQGRIHGSISLVRVGRGSIVVGQGR